ncbi:DUF29 family protein [Methylobacterium sp. J-092]|uniref:DUF29 family protein n=1 Tax=Methylobacterium sp. J-092 TaxID=2836667 RepID=UPI0024450836|nr:DUF29 family protein [Methylobacterium sp. J-092]
MILADPATYGVMAQILRDEDWTHPLHRGVFEVAGALVAAGEAITLAAVLPRVADVGPDGTPAEAYLAARIAGAPAASEAEPLARRLAAAADIRDRPAPYLRDVYAWAFAQAERLRRGEFSSLEALNLAEEIEDSGTEIYNRLESVLRITLIRLLTWDFQPEKRTRSWALSIRTGRRAAAKLLERNPGLKSRLSGAIREAYDDARIEAAGETGLDGSIFPDACPYSHEAIMTGAIAWPPEPEAG